MIRGPAAGNLMDLAVFRERREGERRVALTPDHLGPLGKLGFSFRIEAGAGRLAGWPDEAYVQAGGRIAASRNELLDGASVGVRIRPPQSHELDGVPRGFLLISFLSPADPDPVPLLAERGIDGMALERTPRTTRAQRMDALSSQSTAAGYRGALLAAQALPRFLPMLTTAAGTIKPARVLVLGAGVAGLQAIATARRLGARVDAYDIRPAAAEQVRSLGAGFIEAPLPEEAEVEGGYARALSGTEEERQHALLSEHIPRADAVITTAQIPGRPAPLLITRAMVEAMAPGSVVVDLAADSGGNCELSQPGQATRHGEVTILAPEHPAKDLPQDASSMLGRNIVALLEHLVSDGELTLSTDDDIIHAMLVVKNGEIRFPASRGDA